MIQKINQSNSEEVCQELVVLRELPTMRFFTEYNNDSKVILNYFSIVKEDIQHLCAYRNTTMEEAGAGRLILSGSRENVDAIKTILQRDLMIQKPDTGAKPPITPEIFDKVVGALPQDPLTRARLQRSSASQKIPA